jgi:hypothetical protein
MVKGAGMAGRGCVLVGLVVSLRELPTALAVAGLVVVLVAIVLNAVVAFARTPGGRSICNAVGRRIAPPRKAHVTRKHRLGDS